MVNNITWSLGAAGWQSTEPEDDGSLVFLDNLIWEQSFVGSIYGYGTSVWKVYVCVNDLTENNEDDTPVVCSIQRGGYAVCKGSVDLRSTHKTSYIVRRHQILHIYNVS